MENIFGVISEWYLISTWAYHGNLVMFTKWIKRYGAKSLQNTGSILINAYAQNGKAVQNTSCKMLMAVHQTIELVLFFKRDLILIYSSENCIKSSKGRKI